MFIKDTAGQRIALAIVGSGEVFGELALLDRSPRTATAIAMADSTLLELDRDDLLLLFQTSPTAALRLLAAMGRMTRKADELLRTRVSRNANEEVEENLSMLQRVVDWISWFSGSMWFLADHRDLVRRMDRGQHRCRSACRSSIRTRSGCSR